MIRTAAIVAAGFGSRLNALTAAQPKGFLQIGGRALIERSIATLRAFGIDHIVIGTGYRAEHYDALAQRLGGITTVRSHAYATTGSMATLYEMRVALDGPFLLLESDLLYEPRAISTLLGDSRETVVLASDATRSGDEVFIETSDTGHLVAMSKDRATLSRVDAELVGITKISRETYQTMCDVQHARRDSRPTLDYESALVEAARTREVHVQREDGLAWCEIDDATHLARAKADILPRVEAAMAETQRSGAPG